MQEVGGQLKCQFFGLVFSGTIVWNTNSAICSSVSSVLSVKLWDSTSNQDKTYCMLSSG